MLVTLFITLLTGKTSVMQYRFGISLWAVGIIIAMYCIFRVLKVKKVFFYPILLALTLAPSFVSTVFTQYFNLLPGTFGILLSLLFLIFWNQRRRNRDLFLAAFFTGFSTYSYFVYFLYFFPLLLMVFLEERKDGWEKFYFL